MIYIVEIPHQEDSRCWSRATQIEIVNVVDEVAKETVYYEATVAELIEKQGLDSIEEAIKKNDDGSFDDIIKLFNKYGLDKNLYASYPFQGYSDIPIDYFDAAVAYIGFDLSSHIIFMNDEEALEALDDDEIWHRHGGWKAWGALKGELTSNGLL